MIFTQHPFGSWVQRGFVTLTSAKAWTQTHNGVKSNPITITSSFTAHSPLSTAQSWSLVLLCPVQQQQHEAILQLLPSLPIQWFLHDTGNVGKSRKTGITYRFLECKNTGGGHCLYQIFAIKIYVSRKKGTLSLNSGFNMMNIFIISGKECVKHANHDKLHYTRGY